jgi:solute carrier family 29 (equilibrative nucleoside transporter), member 1/2/3
MFLAAAPYFQTRFRSDDWILAHFQSSIISVSTVTNLVSMLILANLQSKASYQKRIAGALIINVVVFGLLALSTTYFRGVSAGVYLGFILTMVFGTALATGLIQNGAFAFAAGFGRPQYIQAIMAGQGIAGVLPPIAQIVSVLAVPPPEPSEGVPRDTMPPPPIPPPQQSSTAAFVYFLTAAAVCITALLAFIPLVQRHNRLMESRMMESMTSTEEAERAQRKVVDLWTLYKKLHWLAAAVFMCFAVTMFFPVFTVQIVSNTPPDEAPRLFQPASFIPLAFLFWNTGDLFGRLSTLLPFSLRHRPALLFVVAVGRLGFLPLYLLCNVRGRGALVPSDVFYLFVVQLGFGLTNGWLGSSCMMAAPEWVEDGEREATGGFMGLNLVAGLTVGSLLSFTAARP